MRFIVIGMFLLILFSRGSALFFLVNDKGNSNRTVKALTVRIALSLILFLLLMGSYYFGLIPSQGLR
jgi:glycerol uptake facilitator-like aquaporin